MHNHMYWKCLSIKYAKVQKINEANIMFNQSRRTFIKGVAYSSALTVGSLTSVAMATDVLATKTPVDSGVGSALPTCDISIKPSQNVGTEVVTLTNHTNSKVKFNSITSMGLQHVNKHLAVKVNKLGVHAGQGTVTLAPGEQLSFVVAALSSDDSGNANNKNLFIPNVLLGKLIVSSDHPEFTGIIPVTVFETA